MHTTSSDNLYKEGMLVSTKKPPHIKLIITKYYQRIYYCSEVGHPGKKELAYFEGELIPNEQ